MKSFPVGRGASNRLTLILLLALAASGCKEVRFQRKARTFYCGDRTVKVNTNNGAEPQAVYVCEDDTVNWDANGHTFVVEFKKDSPFADNAKKFDNQHAKSARAKHFDQLTVYEYKITVDGTNVFDPQVIGGGGTP